MLHARGGRLDRRRMGVNHSCGKCSEMFRPEHRRPEMLDVRDRRTFRRCAAGKDGCVKMTDMEKRHVPALQ